MRSSIWFFCGWFCFIGRMARDGAGWRGMAQAHISALMMRQWLGGRESNGVRAPAIASFIHGAVADLASGAVRPMLRKTKANARHLSGK
jgi:hypothetical protein